MKFPTVCVAVISAPVVSPLCCVSPANTATVTPPSSADLAGAVFSVALLTRRAGEGVHDGLAGDVNRQVGHRRINGEGEVGVRARVADGLEQGHLRVQRSQLRSGRGEISWFFVSFAGLTRDALADSRVTMPMAAASSEVATSMAWPPDARASSLYSLASELAILVCRRLLRFTSVVPEIMKLT